MSSSGTLSHNELIALFHAIVALISQGREGDAQALFEAHVRPQYEAMRNGQLKWALTFAYDVSEYLNVPSARSTGLMTREKLQERLREVCEDAREHSA